MDRGVFFWTFAKNLPLIIKTPGGFILFWGESFLFGEGIIRHNTSNMRQYLRLATISWALHYQPPTRGQECRRKSSGAFVGRQVTSLDAARIHFRASWSASMASLGSIRNKLACEFFQRRDGETGLRLSRQFCLHSSGFLWHFRFGVDSLEIAGFRGSRASDESCVCSTAVSRQTTESLYRLKPCRSAHHRQEAMRLYMKRA